jgi:DNA-binding response OmpR family regulator
MISFILARTHIDAIPDYILEPVSVEELVAFVRDLQRRLSEMAFPEMPS